MNPLYSDKKHNTSGQLQAFTLVELIVSVGLFSLIATTAVGALLVLTSGEQKTHNVQTSQDNIRFAIESMAREIRAGIEYTIPTPPLGFDHPQPIPVGCATSTPYSCSDAQFRFQNADRNYVVYRIGIGTDCRGSNSNARCILKKVEIGVPPFSEEPITAPEVSIDKLRFYLQGNNAETPKRQQRVTIVIKAQTPGSGSLVSQLNVQTTVSGRVR